MTRKRWFILIAVIALALLIGGGIFGLHRANQVIDIQITPDNVKAAQLVERDGQLRYEITRLGGSVEALTPQTYAELVYDSRQDRGLGYTILVKLFNVSSPATLWWVLLGLLGQVLFAGRMIVQWVVSERRRQSVVPTAFWWLALSGASLLVVYFFWRKDIVGILGQSTGWLIYMRNLYFIYFPSHSEDTPHDGGDVNDKPTGTIVES